MQLVSILSRQQMNLRNQSALSGPGLAAALGPVVDDEDAARAGTSSCSRESEAFSRRSLLFIHITVGLGHGKYAAAMSPNPPPPTHTLEPRVVFHFSFFFFFVLKSQFLSPLMEIRIFIS